MTHAERSKARGLAEKLALCSCTENCWIGASCHESSTDEIEEALLSFADEMANAALEEAAMLMNQGTEERGYYGMGPEVLAQRIRSLKSAPKEGK